MIIFEARCDVCKKSYDIKMKYEEYEKWCKGAPVQEAFPDMPAPMRELLHTPATCPECWEKMFGPNPFAFEP